MRKDIHTEGIPVLCASCEARHRGVCGALEPDQLVALSKVSHKHKAGEGGDGADQVRWDGLSQGCTLAGGEPEEQAEENRPQSGMLSCFFHGCSIFLVRSMPSARAIRRRVEWGMITSSM